MNLTAKPHTKTPQETIQAASFTGRDVTCLYLFVWMCGCVHFEKEFKDLRIWIHLFVLLVVHDWGFRMCPLLILWTFLVWVTSYSPLVISVLLNFGRLSTFISVSMRTLDNKTLKKDVTNKQEKAVQVQATSAILASWMTLKWTMGLRQVGICVFFL